ncbi:MAG: hypothetical protein WC382_00930 [Methanoregulaceae archaeon]|jgi:hypothetical protein
MKGFDIGIPASILAGVILSSIIVFLSNSPVFAVIAAAVIGLVAWHLKNIFGREHAIRKLKFSILNFEKIPDEEQKKISDLSIYLKNPDLQKKLLRFHDRLRFQDRSCETELIVCLLEKEFAKCQNEAIWTVLSFSMTLTIMSLIFWIFRFPLKCIIFHMI